MNVNGCSAVVTGGGNGIGRALCTALAQNGVNVAVADIEEAAAHSVAEDLTATHSVKTLAVATDVTDDASWQNLANTAIAAFGSVEILVNNAGVMHPSKPLYKTTKEDFEWLFAVNVGAALNGIRTFVPHFMSCDKACSILNTASEHALGVPHVGGGIYTATKHAVLGLSDVLRQELPDHIKVSVLCPGIVDSTLWHSTERRQSSFGGSEQAPEIGGAFMKQVGMPASEVAEKAIQGIQEEEFLIVTHPHAIELAQSRWNEINRAFSEQAPRFEGDEKYDLAEVMKHFLQAQEASTED